MKKVFLMAAVLLSAVVSTAGVRYRRSADEVDISGVASGSRIRIFAEWTPYNLGQNFMGYWIERPLFVNRAYRNNGYAAHLKELQIFQRYGIEGMASLDYVSTYKQQTAFEIQANIPGIEHLLVIPAYAWPKNYQMIREAMLQAVKSPLSPRINGKVICSVYGSLKPEQMKAMIAKLKSDPEIGDSFLVPGNMPFSEFHGDFSRYISMGAEPPAWFLEKYRKAVQEVLASSDGIVLYIKDAERAPGEQIWTMILLPYFEKYIYPIIKEEMAKEQNRGKILTGMALRGYVNHLSGKITAEYGTSQLRTYLNTMLKIRPDIIVLFEWNEANENTCLQPCVSSSWSLARLINCYKRIYNGQQPIPQPSDDTTVPNLILSNRQRAKIGELINYEILNVPDGVFKGKIKFSLTLRNQDNQVLITFPEETMDTEKISSISYKVATDDFGDALAVTPELLITTADGKSTLYNGFDSTVLMPSYNVVYKETSMALRDLLIPEKASFQVTPAGNGEFKIDGSFAAGEKLKTLEVIDCHTEVAAADPAKEFDYENDAVFHGYFTSMGLLLKTNGTFKVKNVSRWQLRADGLAHGTCNTISKNGDTAEVFTYFWWMHSPFVLAIPKNEVANAELEISYPDPVGKQIIKLADLHKLGRYSALFGKHVRLDMILLNRLPDYPVDLTGSHAEIKQQIKQFNRYPVYVLRAISESGKIWRSRPVVPIRPAGKKVPMTIFSEFVAKPAVKSVAADFIPVIDYRFTPSYGALLTNGYDQFFNGELGGGFSYLEPMHKTAFTRIPKNFNSLAPAWKQDNGRWILVFDGVSNYVNLPRETMPRGAYKIEMEFRTPGNREQVLLRSYSNREQGTLQMILTADNELQATSAVNLWNAPFKTGLKIEPGKWNRVVVSYDLKTLTFEVNGKKKSYPFSGRGFVFKPGCFGGTDEVDNFKGAVTANSKYFKGELRKLTITHNNR